MKRRSLFMSLKMQLLQPESLEGNFCCERRKNWSLKMTVCLCLKVLLVVCSIKLPQNTSYIYSAFIQRRTFLSYLYQINQER